MQYFDRDSVPPPEYLRGPEADKARYVLRDYFHMREEKRVQTSFPRITLDLEHRTIHEALRRLFHEKCAFCEAQVPTAPYQFRPAREAAPVVSKRDAHLYYVWLAAAWDNLYPICDSCRPLRPDYFPVRGARMPLPTLGELHEYVRRKDGRWPSPLKEGATFIDPSGRSDEEPHLHFRVQMDGSLVGLTDRGTETIGHFRLNRFERAKARRTHFEANLRSLVEKEPADTEYAAVFHFPLMEFGGAWYTLLRRVAVALGGLPERDDLGPEALRYFFMGRANEPEFHHELLRAIDGLRGENTRGSSPLPNHPRPRGSRVRLVSLSVQNFKAIESLTLKMPAERNAGSNSSEPPAPALLILGENAAGKSSVLEAAALAITDQTARKRLRLASGNLLLDPAYMAGEGSRPHHGTVSVRWSDGGERVLQVGPRALTEVESGPDELPPVFAYGAFRQFLSAQRRYTPDRHIRTLFHSAEVLSNPEKWLLKLPEDRFSMVVRALRPIFSLEGEFEVIERDRNGKRCHVVTEVASPSGGTRLVRTPLTVVSSGFRSVLAMVCDIMRGLMDERVHHPFENLRVSRAVVLIDEIEAHLHPRWKMQIMRGLREALPGVTFIATTHDPLCLRGMEDGEVVVLQRVSSAGEGRSEHPVFVEAITELPAISQLTVEQLLTSDFFQLFTTDKPDIEQQLARAADLLAKKHAGIDLDPDEKAVLNVLENDVAAALPVGSSELHRLVQEAVADFLAQRRQASAQRLAALKRETKDRIRQALEAMY